MPIWALLDILLLVPLLLLALVSRFCRRRIDVGLGPEPLINSVYHKQALERQGYSAETFVDGVYYTTQSFDVRADRWCRGPVGRVINRYVLFVRCLFVYRCLYFYFSGGALFATPLLWKLEPLLYQAAGIKTVVMAYGGDVQEMTRSPNLLFKHAMGRDYREHAIRRPRIARRIDLWTRGADHVIGGCEWVDYMVHWDTLMLAHFAIDTGHWQPIKKPQRTDGERPNRPLRVLHAPNHREIKGTRFFVQAIEELRAEGAPIELVILERVSNEKVRETMATVDVVADQLIVGWYAMFALEAMAMEKPVLCYLRPDLEELYTLTGLLEPGEAPLINCTPDTVKETLRRLANDRSQIAEIGRRSGEFVVKHHSLDAVGRVFAGINKTIGLKPSRLTGHSVHGAVQEHRRAA